MNLYHQLLLQKQSLRNHRINRLARHRTIRYINVMHRTVRHRLAPYRNSVLCFVLVQVLQIILQKVNLSFLLLQLYLNCPNFCRVARYLTVRRRSLMCRTSPYHTPLYRISVNNCIKIPVVYLEGRVVIVYITIILKQFLSGIRTGSTIDCFKLFNQMIFRYRHLLLRYFLFEYTINIQLPLVTFYNLDDVSLWMILFSKTKGFAWWNNSLNMKCIFFKLKKKFLHV